MICSVVISLVFSRRSRMAAGAGTAASPEAQFWAVRPPTPAAGRRPSAIVRRLRLWCGIPAKSWGRTFRFCPIRRMTYYQPTPTSLTHHRSDVEGVYPAGWATGELSASRMPPYFATRTFNSTPDFRSDRCINEVKFRGMLAPHVALQPESLSALRRISHLDMRRRNLRQLRQWNELASNIM